MSVQYIVSFANIVHILVLYFTYFFRKSLQLAKQLGDLALEAQACYSLGNTYTLIRDYSQSIDYHARHLSIAEQLQDKLGQVCLPFRPSFHHGVPVDEDRYPVQL